MFRKLHDEKIDVVHLDAVYAPVILCRVMHVVLTLMQNKRIKLLPVNTSVAEYIWLDAAGVTRSKTKTLSKKPVSVQLFGRSE